MTWRYIAQRISGPMAGQFLDWNLPLRGVEIADAIGPSWLSAQISPPQDLGNAEDGLPILDKWSTAIWAEESGLIRGGGILVDKAFAGPAMSLQCMGYAGYPKGIVWTDSKSWIQADPLDVVREIWAHVQSFANAKLNVMVDTATHTPVRIGNEESTAEGATPTSGPYVLNWWEAPDCGQAIDTLAGSTPFDTHERHQWNEDHTDIEHYVDFGYPRLGRRRNDLRFMIGENVQVLPTVQEDGDEYANEVIGLGSGTGRTMVRATVAVPDHRLRRTKVYPRKSEKNVDLLRKAASQELAFLSHTSDIDSVTVSQHPNAPLGSWSPGDEILLQGTIGWRTLNEWCRVIETITKPEDGNKATLTLERVS